MITHTARVLCSKTRTKKVNQIQIIKVVINNYNNARLVWSLLLECGNKNKGRITDPGTTTSRVVRYSDTTRSSLLTMSFKLRVCKFPLKRHLFKFSIDIVNILIHFICT